METTYIVAKDVVEFDDGYVGIAIVNIRTGTIDALICTPSISVSIERAKHICDLLHAYPFPNS